MHSSIRSLRLVSIGALMALLAAVRVGSGLGLSHSPLANFTPLGAMALFGGAFFGNRLRGLLFPLLTLWLSDLFLDRFLYVHSWTWFYPGFYWTYGAFALMVLVGRQLMRKPGLSRLLPAALAVTAIHWILTDFGVWLDGRIFPHTAAGWWSCLLAAIPYEGNILAGTWVYGIGFFGLFAWMQQRFPARLAQGMPVEKTR